MITLSALSPRQREIAELVADGLSVKAIGTRLDLSKWTVRNHMADIHAKIGHDPLRRRRERIVEWVRRQQSVPRETGSV